MTNKVIGGSSPNESLENNPFRLIFHIGAGKTGTSSIQETLRTQRENLKQQGVWYLGLMLEHAPVHQFSWQKAGGSQDFLALDGKRATQQSLEVLRKSIPELKAAGCRQAIWSNEWFFGHGTDVVLETMRQLVKDQVDVRIMVYVRRHDAWARSAYVQWGLKHKTYQGPIQPFERWIKQRPPQFFKSLGPWLGAFGDRVVVRNLDAVGDAVLDFMKMANISPDGLEALRVNETPSGEELVFRALFNEQFKEKTPIFKFDRLFGKALRFDRQIDGWLSHLLPDEAALRDVADKCEDDRHALNELLAASGQPPIDTSPLPNKPVKIDPQKILATVCQLVLSQGIKIQELERKLSENESPLPQKISRETATLALNQSKNNLSDSARPVFVISTGRSGSTLVQRILNCHKDLVIWGEHFGFLEGIGDAYVQMLNPEHKLYQENPGPDLLLPTLQNPGVQLEWVNPWPVEDFKVQLRQFIENYFASRLKNGQRWGFKEIRYNSLPVLRMLRDLYPEGKFIFVRRDPIEVARSKVFSFIKEDNWSGLSEVRKEKRIENLLREVQGHYAVYDTFTRRNPGHGLIVDYEELVAAPREVTERMLSHLRLEQDRFDWLLGEQVMGNVIARTKRDDEMMGLIRKVAATMARESL